MNVVMITPPSENDGDLVAYLERQRKAMKVKVVSDLLGVSKQLLYEWISRGSLEAFDFDGTIRIDPRTLAKFLRDRRTIAATAVLQRAA